jgi:hypothetical protein
MQRKKSGRPMAAPTKNAVFPRIRVGARIARPRKMAKEYPARAKWAQKTKLEKFFIFRL